MKGQIDLLTGREVSVVDELTPRQRAVYELVLATVGGITADEAGAVAHTLKSRPHGRDDRCEWCGQDGRQILHTLRDKGLVRGRRGDPHSGLLYVPASRKAAVSAVTPALNEFPPGF